MQRLMNNNNKTNKNTNETLYLIKWKMWTGQLIWKPNKEITLKKNKIKRKKHKQNCLEVVKFLSRNLIYAYFRHAFPCEKFIFGSPKRKMGSIGFVGKFSTKHIACENVWVWLSAGECCIKYGERWHRLLKIWSESKYGKLCLG